jgi:glucokinase
MDYFSSAMASLMQIINPDVFVLGGAVLLHNSWLIEKLTTSTKNKVFEQLKDKVKLVISAYGQDAGMIGAGYLAMKPNHKGEGQNGELKSSFGGSR